MTCSIPSIVMYMCVYTYTGVSKNSGTPNGWFIVENLIKMDDLGGKPTIFGNIHTCIYPPGN